jgi:hypothetical protein
MFATVIIQGSGVGSDFIEVPTGWTELVQMGCGTDFLQSTSYRIAAGTDEPGAPYIWNFCSSSPCTGSNPVSAFAAGSIVNYADVSTSTPIQSGTGAPECNCSDSTTPTADGLTPTVANSLVIAQHGAVGDQELSAPAGFSSIFEHSGNAPGPDNRESWAVLPASPTGAVSSNYTVASPVASDNIGCLFSANPAD